MYIYCQFIVDNSLLKYIFSIQLHSTLIEFYYDYGMEIFSRLIMQCSSNENNREFQQEFTTDLPKIYQPFTNDLPKIYQK